ncbi:MAG TPA: MerR family transcriptional regulator [Methylosinus sp.]
MNGKSEGAFRTIGEVAESLDLPPHVLRFWETRFSEIEPVKRAGGRRYYRPRDVELVAAIRHLLYGRGYTIKGVQRLLREQGARAVIESVRAADFEPKGGDLGEDEGEPSLFSRRDEPPPSPEEIEILGPDSEDEPGRALVPLARLAPVPHSASLLVEASGRLAPHQERRLRAALEELSECRRMLLLTLR